MPSEEDIAVADRVGTALIRLIRLIERTKAQHHADHPDAVERATYHLLVHLVKGGPRRAVALAEAVHSDPSTISRQVAQLVKAGLARREADPGDGRASRLAITEAGVVACDRLQEARQAWLREVLGEWPADRIAAFAGLFEEFNNSVEAHLRTEPAATPRENA